MKFNRKIMTAKELATYLGVHQSTVYRLVKMNLIPCAKIGSDWRFDVAEVDEWLKKGGSKGESTH